MASFPMRRRRSGADELHLRHLLKQLVWQLFGLLLHYLLKLLQHLLHTLLALLHQLRHKLSPPLWNCIRGRPLPRTPQSGQEHEAG